MAANGRILAADGRTNYRIIIAEEPAAPVLRAAMELQRFLEESTHAHFPVGDDSGAVGEREIVVGMNRHSEALGVEKIDSLEGFIMKTFGETIVLAGGEPRGTMYAVYSFLQDCVGCRWFTPKVSRIPRRERLVVGDIDEKREPALEYREPFFNEAFDGDWSARNLMNSAHGQLYPFMGGKVTYGHFVHTFNVLIPPEKYFKDHPEWFSEIDGKRTDDHTQLCLTNPEVLEKVIEGVRTWIRENPKATILSVSQNDWRNPCTCPACRALDEAEGSHMGTMLTFVNKVAEAIEDEAPHVAIDTLAYQYTRKAPKTVRPRPNVIIRLCSIECCFAHPLEADCPENKAFADDIREWSKIADRLYVWDYVTNFRCYMMPWPNFNVLGPNVRFFANHNVVGLFEQGSYASGGGGEIAEMRAYVLAKLLWDPNVDEWKVRDEFIDGVYGQAADAVRKYHDLIHEAVKDPDNHMHIFCDVDNGHMPEDMMVKADDILAEAETRAESEAVRQRVEVVRLGTQYAKIRRMDPSDPERQKLVDKYMAVCNREGFISIGEARTLERWVETGAGDPNDAR